MKTNAYFNEMRKALYDWRAAKKERAERKKTIVETCGWESEELRAWYEEEAAAKHPFSGGESKAYQAWAVTVSRGEEELEMDDFLWDTEAHDFVETLRKAGIRSFVYTNKSTSVMENLHALAAEGCEMTGLCMIARMEERFGTETLEKIPGVRFTVK